ncbi:hypothetical protein HPB49_011387 [Dermacentor silvarum]|uniref:Uncharacterized protein n=1 Tax=Dermacentor silvarum TaxID=543639 RepID=A0ACB8DCZ1_DERSI|nr:hypothetical protein HPB49_011387 [Dermacentor silvarum]
MSRQFSAQNPNTLFCFKRIRVTQAALLESVGSPVGSADGPSFETALVANGVVTAGNSPQQSSLEECITRARSKKEDANDIPHQFCRALCHAGITLHQADGPLGSLFRSKCQAARTMPSSDQLYRKYLHEVSDKDLATISSLLKDEPISVTIDESPELRGRPAVAVLATFYDDELPGRRTLMIDLQIVQQCNAVSIGMLIQTALQKVGKTLGDVAVLCSDSVSYVQKLHKDLQLSNPDLQALHFKDPCHLLNNAPEDGIRTSSFNVVHDFVVHFPAMLKSSRELRRKVGLVCLAMDMTIKSLKTICPSRWLSFYEALEDNLDYWRAILSFLRSDEAKGTKVNKYCQEQWEATEIPDLVNAVAGSMRKSNRK